MRSYTRRTLLTATLAMLGGVAIAQSSGPGMGRGGGPGMMGGMGPGLGGGPGMGMGMMTDPGAYLDGLKTQLGITSAQEAAWMAYAETVKKAADQMREQHQTMWEAMPTASWQERRDMMNRMFQARQEAFKAVHEAAVKLESSLDASQRGKAATMLPGLMSGRPMGPG